MNRVTRRENKREQKILKALSKGERGFARILKWLFYLLEVFCFMRMVYYGRFEMRGISTEGRFQNELIAFLIVAGCIAFLMLFDWGMKKSWEKEADFDPQQMKLPEAGSVDLEKALHYMSMCQGVIAWDTCWGTFALFFTITLFIPGANIPVVLLFLSVPAVMLAAGHFLILHRFRKRRYAGKMLKNTMEYCRVTDGQGYIAAIEESVKQGVWYYSREWILTKDYMIGKVITDVGFYPVAVPRALITEIVFFRKRPVMNRMRRLDQGILVCCLPGGKPVEFLIGQGARSQRVLKILNYYGIPWQEAPMVYGYGNSM